MNINRNLLTIAKIIAKEECVKFILPYIVDIECWIATNSKQSTWLVHANLFSMVVAFLVVICARMSLYGHYVCTRKITPLHMMSIVLVYVMNIYPRLSNIMFLFCYVCQLCYDQRHKDKIKMDAKIMFTTIYICLKLDDSHAIMLVLSVLCDLLHQKDIIRAILIWLKVFTSLLTGNYLLFVMSTISTLTVLGFYAFDCKLSIKYVRHIVAWIIYECFMLYMTVVTCGYQGLVHLFVHLVFVQTVICCYFHTESEYARFVGWCNNMNLVPVGQMSFDGMHFRFKMTQMWKIFSDTFTPGVYNPNLFPPDFVPDLSYTLLDFMPPMTITAPGCIIQPYTSEIFDPDWIRILIVDSDIKISCRECANDEPTKRYFRHALFNRIIISNTQIDADANMLNGFDVSIRKNNTYVVDIYGSICKILRKYSLDDIRFRILKYIMMTKMQKFRLTDYSVD